MSRVQVPLLTPDREPQVTHVACGSLRSEALRVPPRSTDTGLLGEPFGPSLCPMWWRMSRVQVPLLTPDSTPQVTHVACGSLRSGALRVPPRSTDTGLLGEPFGPSLCPMWWRMSRVQVPLLTPDSTPQVTHVACGSLRSGALRVPPRSTDTGLLGEPFGPSLCPMWWRMSRVQVPLLTPDREPQVTHVACGSLRSEALRGQSSVVVSVVGALCTLGMVPSRPFWKSSNAVSTSAFVFMTNGPAQATGSRIGCPPRTST